MNVKLFFSVAFALSICVACSERDSSEPRKPAVETETVEVKDDSFVLHLPRRKSATEKIFDSCGEKSKTTLDHASCVCKATGYNDAIIGFPTGDKYLCRDLL